MTDTKEAAERILSGVRFIQGKRLPIKFPDDETAMAITAIITNAANTARAYLALERDNARMREAPAWRLHIDIGILLNILQAHIDMVEEGLGCEDAAIVASIEADYQARSALNPKPASDM